MREIQPDQKMGKDQPNASSDFRFSIFDLRIASLTLSVATALLASLLAVPAISIAQAPATAVDRQALLDQADEVLGEMSKLTGLPIKAPLKKKILSRPEIRQLLEQTLDQEYTPQQIHKEEGELKAFGLVSKEFDLRDFLLTFYTEQAAGVYDPRSKTMILADWTPAELQRTVLAHELTHALQDQNFDLLEFTHAQRENADAMAARQAVVEGHATAAMIQQMMGGAPLGALPNLQPMMEGAIQQQFAEFPAFTKAPYFFRLQALFPYIHGMGFAQRALRVEGSWEKFGEIFKNPPTLTKEIFEPQIYFDGHPPAPIALARPPAMEKGGNLRVLSENTFGQLGYLALLGQFISEAEAKTVAPAWLADRFIVYEGKTDGSLALVARTRWTGSESALAFFRGYRTILSKKYPGLTSDSRSGGDLLVASTASGNVILLRKGDECRWAEGIPPDKTDAMLKWLESL